MLLAKTCPLSTAQRPSLCHRCPNPCPWAPVGTCPLKDPDSQGKRKMLFKTSLCCVLFVCNCSTMLGPSRAAVPKALTCLCTQTRVRHTRTLQNSCSAQTASCNLSHTINRADAALEPLGPVKSLSPMHGACMWPATVPIYVQRGNCGPAQMHTQVCTGRKTRASM